MDSGLYAVRVGDVNMYGTRHATAEETYNIDIRNVRTRGQYAISLAREIANLSIENIKCIGNTKLLNNRS